MSKKWIFYTVFFAVLLGAFYYFVMKDRDFSKSPLPVINADVADFTFTDQNGKPFTQKMTEDKVYVAEYFFTTCKGICPKMNANMRRVWDAYKDEKEFLILSHTCMPETDSVPLLKAYELKMTNGKLSQSVDGSYSLTYNGNDKSAPNNNWFFVTGDKADLYKMARTGYLIDNQKPDSTQNIANQFIHTQFFALMDKYHRVRGIYDGLKDAEIQKLITDIDGLLKEKVDHKRFMNGFSNDPN